MLVFQGVLPRKTLRECLELWSFFLLLKWPPLKKETCVISFGGERVYVSYGSQKMANTMSSMVGNHNWKRERERESERELLWRKMGRKNDSNKVLHQLGYNLKTSEVMNNSKIIPHIYQLVQDFLPITFAWVITNGPTSIDVPYKHATMLPCYPNQNQHQRYFYKLPPSQLLK